MGTEPAITYEQVHDAYLTYADYDIVEDVNRARQFVLAVRRLIAFSQSSSKESASMSFDLKLLVEERKRAEAYIATNIGDGADTGGLSFGCFDFSGFER